MNTPAALRFTDVTLVRGGVVALDRLTWCVGPGERWVVMGPNGSGKTSTLQVASGLLHPTRGTVDVLGHRLGRVDVRRLRERIGLTSAAVAQALRPGVRAADIVMTGRHAALEAWWHGYDEDDRLRARRLLDEAGFGHVSEREFGVLSEGERKQVLLARSLMAQPDMLLLDEPMAGVDLVSRELLVTRLGALAADPETPPIVLVTHHLEEVPPSFTHVLLMRAGAGIAMGTLGDTLTAASIEACFGLPVRLLFDGGRYACRAV